MPRLPEYVRLRKELPDLKLVYDSNRAAHHVITSIGALSDEELFGGTIHDSDMARAARAGLLLSAGALEEAHRIVQDFDTPEAQYWHGIVHRREPDFSNAKYWFRRLGHHAVFDQLASEAVRGNLCSTAAVKQILQGGRWDSFRFVDLCESCAAGELSELLKELLAIQKKEMEFLLDYCVNHALAPS